MTADTAAPDVSTTALEGTIQAAHDFSLWGLFWEADIVVKAVMMGLLLASIWCWAIIVSKRGLLKKLNKRGDKFEETFWSGESLDTLHQRVQKSATDPLLSTFSSGMDEWKAIVGNGLPQTQSAIDNAKQRIERSMSLTMAREMQNLEKGMTFLASTGSTAPFIGLFGTVWGIMNTFTAIGAAQNTSLVVVAPGIAEALFATAIGLVAAIPAVIAFNIFSSQINNYADRLDGFITEFMAIVGRHLDGQNEQQQQAA